MESEAQGPTRLRLSLAQSVSGEERTNVYLTPNTCFTSSRKAAWLAGRE